VKLFIISFIEFNSIAKEVLIGTRCNGDNGKNRPTNTRDVNPLPGFLAIINTSHWDIR
jgi:hypothetical protein